MITVFWLSVSLILYTYLGFPLLVVFRGLLWKRPYARGTGTPSISFVIVAHNEAKVIGKKLENLLSLDYPREQLEIIIASDGSDDGTDEIVAGYRDSKVRLVACPRRGKIPALNDAVASATGELLVFSDANSIFRGDALRRLAAPFSDPKIGGVAGNQTYASSGTEAATGMGERLYWRFDQLLKRYQGGSGSVISATGAIYAIRRALFRPVPGGVSDDAVISYRVIAAGFRVVFEPEAVAFEHVAPSAEAEFRRKVRVCVRGLQALTVEPGLFNPFWHGFYSLQLISHKLLRWLLVWPLLAALLTSLLLTTAHPVYLLIAAVQLVFYGMALAVFILTRLGYSVSRLPGPLKAAAVPFYFCLANTATIVALFKFIFQPPVDRWEVRRGS